MSIANRVEIEEKGNKQYKIGDELEAVIIEYNALISLRDTALSKPFGYKKAKKASIEARKISINFWKKVTELYPEIAYHRLKYLPNEKAVIITD